MDFPTTDMLPATRLFLAVLLHFVWQATLVVALVAIFRSLIHPRYCQLRYAVSVFGLAVVLIFPLATLAYYTVNTGAMLALFPSSAVGASASIESAQPATVIGQLEAQFQIVFSWFDNHRLLWLGGWLIGFTVLLLRLSLSLRHCFRLRRNQKPLPPRLQKLAANLKQKLGITQEIVVGISHEITQAVATGIIKPVVLLPAAWVTQLPVSAIEAVLAHELAHVKRWDLWVNYFQRLAETVFFFHPLVWWLSKKISTEREICCDQLAVRTTGQPMRYVETLAHVAGTNHPDDFEFQFGTAFTGGKNMNLLRRAKLILEPGSINAQSPLRTLALIVGVGLLVSYGSYTCYAAAAPAIAALQDEDHDHDHNHDHDDDRDHDHEIHAEQDGHVFKLRRQSGGDEDIDVFVVDGSHQGDDHAADLHRHLIELLHRNEKGDVSPQDLAKKLRQMADHLESRNSKVRSARNVERNVERKVRVQKGDRNEFVVEKENHEEKNHNRRVEMLPRAEKRPDNDRGARDRHEVVIVLEDEGDRHDPENNRFIVQARKHKPHEIVVEKEVHRAHGDGDLHPHDNDLPLGHASTSDSDLGKVLHELKNEVQQLRREVKQLQSARHSQNRDDRGMYYRKLQQHERVRGTLERRPQEGRSEFRHRDGQDDRDLQKKPQSEFRDRRSNERAATDDASANEFWIEAAVKQSNRKKETDQLLWVEKSNDGDADKQSVRLKWIDEPDNARRDGQDDADVQLEIIEKAKRNKEKK